MADIQKHWVSDPHSEIDIAEKVKLHANDIK